MSNDQFEVPEPTYEWVDRHNERAGNLQRATGKAGGLWGIVPGLVYCGAVVLLSAVLGTEIARLFASHMSFRILAKEILHPFRHREELRGVAFHFHN